MRVRTARSARSSRGSGASCSLHPYGDRVRARVSHLDGDREPAADLAAATAMVHDGALADLAGQTRTVIADVRRLVYALRPPALDELGLVDAIGQAGQAVADGMHFEFNRPDELPPLPAAVEVAAYRITQEALNNVVRHSGARHCRLTLSMTGGDLRLEVSDDGSGIPAGAPAGIGLSSMRERAEELGGRLELDTAQGAGTRLAAFFPCAREG